MSAKEIDDDLLVETIKIDQIQGQIEVRGYEVDTHNQLIGCEYQLQIVDFQNMDESRPFQQVSPVIKMNKTQ